MSNDTRRDGPLEHVVPLATPVDPTARRGRGGRGRRRHHGCQHRLPPRRGRGHRRGRARTEHPRLGVVREAAGRRPGHVLRREQRRARACGACARSRPSPTGSASTSACARSATCSSAGPRPSWRQWRPASGCRTDSAATAAWSPRREACEINPMLDPGPLLGASFSPRDGYCRTRPGGRGLRAGRRPARGPVLRAHRGPRARHRRRPVLIRSGPSGGASPPAR